MNKKVTRKKVARKQSNKEDLFGKQQNNKKVGKQNMIVNKGSTLFRDGYTMDTSPDH